MTRRTAPPPAPPAISAIPPTQVLPRLAALQTAPTTDLKQQWRELFGKEPPPGNRPVVSGPSERGPIGSFAHEIG